jgi:hypothetical protein
MTHNTTPGTDYTEAVHALVLRLEGELGTKGERE